MIMYVVVDYPGRMFSTSLPDRYTGLCSYCCQYLLSIDYNRINDDSGKGSEWEPMHIYAVYTSRTK